MSMNINMNISQRLNQKLTMNLKMQQAIGLLSLSAQELMEEINEELQNNPVLEVDEEYSYRDQIFQQFYESSAANETYQSGEQGEREEDLNYPQFVAAGPSLQDYLTQQMHLSRLPDNEQVIGEWIIGQIDEDGYLQCQTAEIARGLTVPLPLVEKVLGIVQGFDPPGVGARNLQECLLIQVRQLPWLSDYPSRELVHLIVSNYLEELAAGHQQQVAKALGVTAMEVQQVIDLLKTLEPKPGRCFNGNGKVEYIVPDIVVKKVDERFVVIVESSVCPNLKINRQYQQLLGRKGELDGDTYNYIKGKLDAAFWLVRSIEQRRLTIQRIMESILEFQYDFFENGVQNLKPLTMKQVADAISMHESTVSRATTKKYAQTPYGIFELKFFFSNGFASGSGDDISAETIRKKLKEIIMGEDMAHPFSDQQIADLFAERNIKISRRTVAKYREELNIPSSSRRRQYR